MRRTMKWMTGVVLILTVVPALPAGAANATRERHCVVDVTGKSADGELQTTEPRCFSSFAAAMEAAGLPAADASEPRAELLSQLSTSSVAYLAVHFDGASQTGSSVTVAGSDCTGGWLNLPTTWINRISSTRNGCGHVYHFDGYNLTGASQLTVGAGGNLTTLNNRTNSIQYLP